jgi:hypothetical protein
MRNSIICSRCKEWAPYLQVPQVVSFEGFDVVLPGLHRFVTIVYHGQHL